MSKAVITLTYFVMPGFKQGDYAQLHSNGGAGEIDWDTPVSPHEYALFPGGAGYFGWRHVPWRQFAWHHGQSRGVNAGWRHLPWRHFPWHHGTTRTDAIHSVSDCGEYIYGLKCFDAAGNAHTGTPDTEALSVHVTPPKAARLKKTSYSKTTDTLILEVA